MRFATVATGAVNGYLAVKLAEAGQDVACLARGAHLEAIRGAGLRLIGASGESVGRPRAASDDPAALGPVDVVLFAVKAQDLDAAAPLCLPLMGPETVVIPFLNGVEASSRLETHLGAGRVMEGTCGISVFLGAPGRIDMASTFAWYRFAERDGTRSERALKIAEAMTAAGIDAAVPEDIRVALWKKFMMLATLAGTTAAGRCAAGDIHASPALSALAARAVAEIGALARAEGVAITEADEAATVEQIGKMPAAMRASMAKDLDAGRPIEVDWLSGAVARMSAARGLDAPAHAAMAALLAPWRLGR
ncbi:MAG: 2-dehydropantoate 2-reductase [Pseudomonadota bacterium]|nr:2-dehydropantoate 2-reductase [Pseudomonadota bacterium]MEE3100904.1 2-dehydropantoate 2-reductase [Pseudomonadota bacterium]